MREQGTKAIVKKEIINAPANHVADEPPNGTRIENIIKRICNLSDNQIDYIIHEVKAQQRLEASQCGQDHENPKKVHNQ